jgi:hypothetical protein
LRFTTINCSENFVCETKLSGKKNKNNNIKSQIGRLVESLLQKGTDAEKITLLIYKCRYLSALTRSESDFYAYIETLNSITTEYIAKGTVDFSLRDDLAPVIHNFDFSLFDRLIDSLIATCKYYTPWQAQVSEQCKAGMLQSVNDLYCAILEIDQPIDQYREACLRLMLDSLRGKCVILAQSTQRALSRLDEWRGEITSPDLLEKSASLTIRDYIEIVHILYKHTLYEHDWSLFIEGIFPEQWCERLVSSLVQAVRCTWNSKNVPAKNMPVDLRYNIQLPLSLLEYFFDPRGLVTPHEEKTWKEMMIKLLKALAQSMPQLNSLHSQLFQLFAAIHKRRENQFFCYPLPLRMTLYAVGKPVRCIVFKGPEGINLGHYEFKIGEY